MNESVELDKLAVIANQKSKEKEFWLRTLSGGPVKSSFPTDYTKQEHQPESRETVSFRFDGDTLRRLMSLRNNFDPRLHLVFTAAVAALCPRYTGKPDVLIGTCIYEQKQVRIYSTYRLF